MRYLPNKVTTNGTKCKLLESGGHELVAVYLMHFAAHRYATNVECLIVLFEHFGDERFAGFWTHVLNERMKHDAHERLERNKINENEKLP